jgi:hypothetical protein
MLAHFLHHEHIIERRRIENSPRSKYQIKLPKYIVIFQLLRINCTAQREGSLRTQLYGA